MILIATALCAVSAALIVVGIAQLTRRRGVVASRRLQVSAREGNVTAGTVDPCASRTDASSPPGSPFADDQGSVDSCSAEKQALSTIAGLRWLLERFTFAERLDVELRGAGSSWNVGAFVLLMLTIGLSAAILSMWLIEVWAIAAVSGVLCTAAPVILISWRRQRRVRAFERHFPDALDMMVNALKSGAGLSSALGVVATEAAAPIDTEFSIILQQQKLGVDLREGLRDLRRRIDVVDVHLFSTALIVQKETGGNLAEVLENIAGVIRDRFQVMGDARTLTAEGRLSGLVLALLPIALAAVIFHLAPEYVRFFIDHPVGRLMLTAAIVMEMLGFLLIRKISNVKL